MGQPAALGRAPAARGALNYAQPMTRLTGVRAPEDVTTRERTHSPTWNRSRAEVLADPRVRLAAGAAAVLVSAVAVHRNRVGPAEARAFRAVNGLPDALYPPAWAVMQLGTLGAAPAAAGLAWLAGDGELAARLLASGSCTWALSKLVKQMVRRPRPATLLSGTRRRGKEAAG